MSRESVRGSEASEVNSFETIALDFSEQSSSIDTDSILAILNEAGLSPHVICQWVPTQKHLQLVSGDRGERLTEDILASWCRSALRVIAVREGHSGELLGFCTLSRTESPNIPHDTVEMCHLIVAPNRGRAWIARYLIASALSVARDAGVQRIVGRVVQDNHPMHRLTTSIKAKPITPLPQWADPNFHWYSLDALPRPAVENVNFVLISDKARSLADRLMRFLMGLTKLLLRSPFNPLRNLYL